MCQDRNCQADAVAITGTLITGLFVVILFLTIVDVPESVPEVRSKAVH